MLFSIRDLEARLPAETLAAGQRLLDLQPLQPEIQRGGELVTAIIQQGGRRALRVYVRVRQTKDGVEIQGECTCSTGSPCGHIAAVLLQALAGEDLLLVAGRVGRTQRPSTAQQLRYLLLTKGSGAQGVAIEVLVGRVGRNGRYDNARRYEPGWALRGLPPRFIQPSDLEILRHLAGCPPGPDKRSSSLANGAILSRILNSGCCHPEGLLNPPLQLGPARAAELYWRMDQAGVQTAGWLLESGDTECLLLEEPWFLDREQGECGPLETGLPPELARELSLLEVDPLESGAVREMLESRFPGFAESLPRRVQVERLAAVEPTPCLYLDTLEQRARGPAQTNEVDLACLRFEYDSHRLGRSDPDHRLVDGRILQQPRDPAGEQAAIEHLLALGFHLDPQWSRETGTDSFLLSATADAWFGFQQQELPRLLEQGWQVEYGAGFRYRLARVIDWTARLEASEDNDWFGLSIGIETDAGPVDLLPALVRLIQQAPHAFQSQRLQTMDVHRSLQLPLEDGRLLPVPLGRLRAILETLFELYDRRSLDSAGRLRLSRLQLARLAELQQHPETAGLQWQGAQPMEQLRDHLDQVCGTHQVVPPAGLQLQLRDYQQQGLEWLQWLCKIGLAGILADDMGLGKTVQTLAHVLFEKEQGRLCEPALVIAPTSLLVNWRREAERFTPGLRVLTLHGPERHSLMPKIPDHDLVLTSYPLLVRDQDALLGQAFHLLILDEAQTIKNPKAKASRLVREIDSRHRLCLTGTPMENHLGELWSLYDFLLPGLLGNERQFQRCVRNPIEKQADEAAAARLQRRLRPFLLRRRKAEVATELPPKTEILRTVELEGGQRDLYETIRVAMDARVRQELEDKGLARSGITILDSLLKLRQACCDPRLVKLDAASEVKESAKLQLLLTLLPEMLDEGRRILLFSQFTSMLELIEQALTTTAVPYVKLTGQTKDRQTQVERFQSGQVPLFLISLKAGGVGLNLTAADTVIHYDPWWNPAVERQASDRAHRIGQEKPVFVYKLLTAGTVEERIQALQERKRALADGLYDGAAGSNAPPWSEQDLRDLFEPLH